MKTTMRPDKESLELVKAGVRLKIGLFAAPIVTALMFGGCAVGPDYKRPAAVPVGNLPGQFGDAAVTNSADWKVAEPGSAGAAFTITEGQWWSVFNDPELMRLEAMATTNNQDLALAVANYAEARAALQTARADFLPQAELTPSMSRQRTSVNASPTSAAAGRSTTFNQYRFAGDASWEVDLWGRVRRSTESAGARLTAVGDDLAAARLSIQASVATSYFSLRSLEEQSALLERTATAYTRALELTQNRRRGGIATELDVAEAETQLRAAQAQLPAIELQRTQTRHALAVLCGQPATTFTLGPKEGKAVLPEIPLKIPSEWLEARPDIAAAERRMASANADIGVATAAFYPRLVLNASGGFESISADALFDWPSRLWAVGPSLQWPIFSGGRNRAGLNSAKATYEGTVASYRATVLTAFQDVEDQLAARGLLARRVERERAALVAAQKALEISNNRYKGGVESYLDVITAQAAALAHEQTVIQLTGQERLAWVGLVKALGGGWMNPTNTSSRRNAINTSNAANATNAASNKRTSQNPRSVPSGGQRPTQLSESN